MTKEELLEIQDEAEQHLKHGRFRMALAFAQEAYGANSNNPFITALLSQAFLENLKPDKALEYINLAVETEPDNLLIREKRASILLRLSIYEGALADLNFISDRSETKDIIELKAKALAGLNRFEEALSLLKNQKETKEIFFLKGLIQAAAEIETVKEKKLFQLSTEAYEQKQFWFFQAASEKLLEEGKFLEESSLLLLKCLVDSFQINKALKVYNELNDTFKQNDNFRNAHNKILRIKRSSQSLEDTAAFLSIDNSGLNDSTFFKEKIDNIESKNYLAVLDSFVGLTSLKESIKNFVAYLNFIKERKSAGLKTDEEISFHCLFLGNPGTGKTSAARLLGGILKQIGILESGHVVEVDRAALVGQYVGETAQKTEKIVNDSLGGILFIDEAYTLKKEGAQHDFGQEAIDILLKRMEDKKGEFIVIAAGYPEEMKAFINSNPGLQSRFTNTFYFDDFNPEELLDIFNRISGKEDFRIHKDAENVLLEKFQELFQHRDKSFGNARLVKNLFNKVKLQLSKRYLDLPLESRSEQHLTEITKSNIEAAFSEIGFADYTPAELFLDVKKQIENKGYFLAGNAGEALKKYFNKIHLENEKKLSDSKIIRSIAEEIIKEHLLQTAETASRGMEIKNIHENVIIKFIEKDERRIASKSSETNLMDKYLIELDNLVGIESVKKDIIRQLNGLKVDMLRKNRGMKVIRKNLNAIFVGNPGTGKKTAARLLSKLYKEMGVIEKELIIEVNKASLIPAIQGQTSQKINEAVNNAIGGILFIEEASSLTAGDNRFGQEAIDSLLKRMEDDSDNLIVIAAGYPDEVRTFWESNPGLKSRFTNLFYFDDFTPRQLLEIALKITSKHSYQLDEGAWQQMLDIFIDLNEARDKKFGNAKSVKNILYKAISFQEERILGLTNPTDEELSTITFEDVEQIRLSEIQL